MGRTGGGDRHDPRKLVDEKRWIHVFPFHGQACVGYVAHEQIIGISKLTRIVRVFAKRFTVQERMGDRIATTVSRS